MILLSARNEQINKLNALIPDQQGDGKERYRQLCHISVMKMRVASKGYRHYPKSDPGHPNNYHHEYQLGLLLNRWEIWAPLSLPSQINSTMRHPAPRGREPSGCDRHSPKPDPGLPEYCYHESMQSCPPCSQHVPRGHGARRAVRP